jgi:hypothetical protein
VEIINYSRRHVNAKVNFKQTNKEWQFTGFYGHPEVGKRKEAWNLLRFIKPSAPTPWLCAGDFNEIIDDSEKLGEKRRVLWQMVDFQRTLQECELHDLGFSRPKFTWSNGQEGSSFIQERLDRAVGNCEWRWMFPEMAVDILAARSSDHTPILIACERQKLWKPSKNFRFKYEVGGGKNRKQKEIIKKVWRLR